MAAQKSTKSVLDYIRQNGEKEGEDGGGGGGGKKKGKKGKGGDKEPEPLPDICDRNAVQIYCRASFKVFGQGFIFPKFKEKMLSFRDCNN